MESKLFFLWLNCLHQEVSFCFSYCVFVGKKPGRDRQCYSRIYYVNLQSTPVRKKMNMAWTATLVMILNLFSHTDTHSKIKPKKTHFRTPRWWPIVTWVSWWKTGWFQTFSLQAFSSCDACSLPNVCCSFVGIEDGLKSRNIIWKVLKTISESDWKMSTTH